MSNKDSQFFNVFSLVLGLLIALALVLLGMARVVGASTQKPQVETDSAYLAAVAERIRPLGRVAVAGQDNSALEIKPEGPPLEASAAPAAPTDGKGVYDSTCTVCHGAGIGGAPKTGDKGAWGPRLAQGSATLYKHALEGFNGKAGVMPPKGGRVDLSDDLIKQAVDHMVSLNK
ncbi:MAG: c-type cytochrome [Steroidobacteraceae bacterium]